MKAIRHSLFAVMAGLLPLTAEAASPGYGEPATPIDLGGAPAASPAALPYQAAPPVSQPAPAGLPTPLLPPPAPVTATGLPPAATPPTETKPVVPPPSAEQQVPTAPQKPAKAVPAIDRAAAPVAPAAPKPALHPPPVKHISDAPVKLTPKEETGVAVAKKWIDAPSMPAPGEDGTIVLTYGATLPAVVCAPLHVCDVWLEPGEEVTDLHAGDGVRWKIDKSVSGSGKNKIIHLIIKPTDAGLDTNIAVATDRRSYSIKLVSTQEQWMPAVRFSYPDDVANQWHSFQKEVATTKTAAVLPGGQNMATLDFHYRMEGDNPSWKPTRVYADGLKTYIEFPQSVQAGDLPALVATDPDDNPQLVNYRTQGNKYVVDKVLEHAALILGVGSSEQRVAIQHTNMEDRQ